MRKLNRQKPLVMSDIEEVQTCGAARDETLPEPSSQRQPLMLAQYFLMSLHRAFALQAVERKPQALLFEEPISRIDASKMERIDDSSASEQRITDNVFRFMQLFVGEDRVLVDLPNTVVSPSESKSLTRRGFTVDSECSFQPLQKSYNPSQIAHVQADLTFVWSKLWHMQSLPNVKVYPY